jgi:hypothetical protein
LACSRELPPDWPTSSAASPDAPAAPRSDVTLALDSDPPLPGEPLDGWFGLDRRDHERHDHERHDHGH